MTTSAITQSKRVAAKELRDAEAAIDRVLDPPAKSVTLIPAPPPGLYPNTSLETYLSWNLPSQSTLKPGKRSAAHLKSALDRESEVKVTDAMALGTVLHMAFLEPEELLHRVAVWDQATKNGSGKRAPRHGQAWDDFVFAHQGKVILTPEQYERVTLMLRSLRANPFVKRMSAHIDGREVAGVGSVNNVLMKARADIVTDEVCDAVIDLKSVRDGDKTQFVRTILNLGYHIQGHVNRRIFGRKQFYLLTVESSPPFDVVPYELDEKFLELGQKHLEPILSAYKLGLETNHWPGRCADGVAVKLEPPEWVYSVDGFSNIVFETEEQAEARNNHFPF